MAQFYCHCHSCQTAHAAPMIAAAIFPATAVSYTGEVARVTVTGREDAAQRLVCQQCGTKVLAEPRPGLRAVLVALCESRDWFRPQMHVQWSERMLDVKDDLPKFLDFPTPFGGSGKLA
ncbi:MAG: GFA family protein [Candidatus Binatia bacterium]